jgi:Phage head-tail joining protein
VAFSYSGNPATSLRDRVRFELADTARNAPILDDEEIDFCIAQEPSIEGAIAKAAENITAKFRRQVNVRVGQLSLDYQARAQRYEELASYWRESAKGASSAVPTSIATEGGGPFFWRGMHDNPGADVSVKPNPYRGG